MALLNGVASANAAANTDSKTGCILHKFALFSPTSSSSVVSGVDSLLNDVWFDIAGVPIKWNIPVGVLYDYFIHAEGLRDKQNSSVMTITVHFQNFPKFVSTDAATGTGFGSIQRWPTLTNMQAQFFYSLKESHFIKHGDIGLINKLTPAQMTQLWNSVQLSDIRSFRSCNETLCPATSPSFSLQNVPLRIMYDPSHPLAQFGLPAESSTIAELLARVNSIISTVGHMGDNANCHRVLYCNGVRMDDQSSIPLQLLYKLFHSFDNYLYFSYLPAPPEDKASPSATTEPTNTAPTPATAEPSEDASAGAPAAQ